MYDEIDVYTMLILQDWFRGRYYILHLWRHDWLDDNHESIKSFIMVDMVIGDCTVVDDERLMND
jgi:hypothetical protein